MISPPPLQPGDHVGIVSTARKITASELEAAVSLLESWNLVPVFSKRLFEEDNQFAGNDEARIEGMMEMFENRAIKAIFCARGGYGTTRILDNLDFSVIARNPKWVVGFSDVTALLCHLRLKGMESIHASMPVLYDHRTDDDSKESLRKLLFGKTIGYRSAAHDLQRNGQAKGKLVGGNLSVLCTIIGTRSFPDLDGAILFLEDLDEYLYHIDRMMVQLKRMGALSKISGLVVGHMSDMRDNTVPFGHNAYDIIHHHLEDSDIPVSFGFPVGHQAENMALVVGREAILEVNEAGTILTYV